MLSLPEEGFNRPVTPKNLDRPIMGDWLEASALFVGVEFSQSDVADILVEQGVIGLSDAAPTEGIQDVASAIAEEGWSEMRNRMDASGGAKTFEVNGDRITTKGDWKEDPIRAFLVLLSLMPLYPKWSEACRDIGQQGSLFEKVSAKACERIFEGWHVYHAGWSANGPKKVAQIVEDLVGLMGVGGNPNLGEWAPKSAKDAGLDLMCFRRFPDARECIPYFAIQCASGANWKTKLQQPSCNEWQGFLGARFQPTRALTIPFVVDSLEMAQKCGRIEGPLFDRNRLLSAGSHVVDWMADIADELINWSQPRIELLPKIDSA